MIIEDDDTKLLFKQFIDFINYIIIELKKQNNNLYFYNLYEEFIKKKDYLNFLDIKDDSINNELKDFIPIISTLRIFNGNKLFCVTYEKISKCNGLCKFKNEKKENLTTLPYLDINENKLLNEKNRSVEDIIFNDIFDERTKICDEGECFIHNKYIYFKYKIF